MLRCAFQAEEELFAAMDMAEALLSQQRYLAGDTFTEADLRLFMTLVRFDEVKPTAGAVVPHALECLPAPDAATLQPRRDCALAPCDIPLAA